MGTGEEGEKGLTFALATLSCSGGTNLARAFRTTLSLAEVAPAKQLGLPVFLHRGVGCSRDRRTGWALAAGHFPYFISCS